MACPSEQREGEKSPLLLEVSNGGKSGGMPSQGTQPLSSTTKTFANLMLCTLGTGVLGLPYTFSTVGWASGLLILAISAAIAYHGMMLLVRSKRLFVQHHPDLLVAGYGDLMFHVFGRYGRLAVDILLTLSTVACGISYLTFITQNIASIASTLTDTSTTTSTSSLFEDAFHHQKDAFSSGGDSPVLVENILLGRITTWTWTSSTLYAWIIFPFEVALAAIPSLTYLAPLSSLADLANLAALAAVAVEDVVEIQKVSGFPAVAAFRNIISVPSAFGVGIYAFQSAGMMIPLELSMAEPWKFGNILGWAFTFGGLIYAGFAMLGYMAFGEDVQQIITLNLQAGIVPIVVKGALCSSLLLALPLEFNPMWELIERRFSERKLSLWLRAVVLFVICLLATTVKQFAVFLSLAGSSISCLLGFILPAALHLKITKEDLEKPPSFRAMAADYVLIAFGLLFGAFGTTVSFINLL